MENNLLDRFWSTTSLGSRSTAIGDNIRGFNHLKTNTHLPLGKKGTGYVFMTRPQLNMQTENISNKRTYYPLLTNESMSSHRWIRCVLDPRMVRGYANTKNQIITYSCPLLDNTNPFIVPVTNNLLTLSGAPEKVIPMMSPIEGHYGFTYSQVDGTNDLYGMYELDMTFKRHHGDNLLRMFSTLGAYYGDVFTGILQPYPDFITENELDYTMGLYMFVMDPSRTYITDMGFSAKVMIKNDPTGALFDYDIKKPYVDESEQFTLRMQCEGMHYNDAIIAWAFNRTVETFNPAMEDGARETSMVKLSPENTQSFKNCAIPYIDWKNDYFKLDWWVTAEEFKLVTTGIGGNTADAARAAEAAGNNAFTGE